MKMSCKLSPDDSNPQEVHGHLLFKKDGFAYSIPSKFTPNLRGFSTKKLLGLGISSRVFSAPLRKREKEGFFKRMNCDSDSSQTSSGESVRVVRQFIFKDIFI
jgi:hypothetical protein